MKDNVLAVLASPRHQGNSELLFQRLIKGAEETGTKVTQLIIRDKKISPCLELYACKKTGQCIIKDDFSAIYQQLETCSKLVIVTPIFFLALPAQLKALIERCQAFYMRKYVLKQPILPEGAHKRPAYLIAVGGMKTHKLFEASKLTLKPFLDCLDMKLAGSFLYSGIDAVGDVLNHPTAMKDVYELGRRV